MTNSIPCLVSLKHHINLFFYLEVFYLQSSFYFLDQEASIYSSFCRLVFYLFSSFIFLDQERLYPSILLSMDKYSTCIPRLVSLTSNRLYPYIHLSKGQYSTCIPRLFFLTRKHQYPFILLSKSILPVFLVQFP